MIKIVAPTTIPVTPAPAPPPKAVKPGKPVAHKPKPVHKKPAPKHVVTHHPKPVHKVVVHMPKPKPPKHKA